MLSFCDYLGIVVKCFQSERSSRQSLQFLRPTHQKFNFISVSGRFGRIFCLFFMARIQFPCKSTALTASFSVRQPPNAPFVLSYPPVAPHLPCGCRRRCKGFPSASSWPWPSGDRSALSVSRTSLPSQSPSLWQVPFGQGLSPFSSHRTDGLFLRTISVSVVILPVLFIKFIQN